MNWIRKEDCVPNPVRPPGRVGYRGTSLHKWSANPLEIPLGPMTQARAKRFKEDLNVLIRDA